MPLPIEDYGLIGDTHTGALVGRDGSIDWWCAPRFDSGACFAALLGGADNGRWLLAPARARQAERRYRPHSLVLETDWDADGGRVRVTDLMPVRRNHPRIVRLVEGLDGDVEMQIELVVRFDYGAVVPWVRRVDDAWVATAGPDSLVLHTPVHLGGQDFTSRASFHVRKGERVPFVLTWHPSHEAAPDRTDAAEAINRTDKWWRDWAGRQKPLDGDGRWHDAVERSLITLKALTYAPTGGIVAAPTTSLPEQVGVVRNWDYRYCWLRDSTFTLYALLLAGYDEEAKAWRDWLLRAVAGRPDQMQILYGAAGERRLSEYEVDWLPGYRGASPVRVGNAASGQFQLDVFGEVMDTLHVARQVGIPENDSAWALQQALVAELEQVWQQPDDGIWEVRGPRRHFVHSKVMAWVAVDRAVKAAEAGQPGDGDRWRALRDEIHGEVCAQGFDADRGTFTQYYGSTALDASLLMMPQVGFLPVEDPRVVGTIDAIESELIRGGLVMRYVGDSSGVDGLPAGEGAFLPCSFWLADAWAMSGRDRDATELLERLLALRNDLGLLAEEWDVDHRCQVGNFPQAFSHLSLVNTARNLTAEERGAAHHRSGHRHPRR
ncbi:MAG TPA: glycoside hydrolase family 15 protein [Acidimicrobiales bacterium]